MFCSLYFAYLTRTDALLKVNETEHEICTQRKKLWNLAFPASTFTWLNIYKICVMSANRSDFENFKVLLIVNQYLGTDQVN